MKNENKTELKSGVQETMVLYLPSVLSSGMDGFWALLDGGGRRGPEAKETCGEAHLETLATQC